MTRRYYRIRALEDVKAFERGRPALRHRRFRTERRAAGPDLDDRRLRRPARRTARAERQGGDRRSDPAQRRHRHLPVLAGRAGRRRRGVDRPARARWTTSPTLAGGRRVTVTVCRDRRRNRCSSSPSGRPSGGLAEERVIRDMHPLTGQRLDLWRLKNFTGTRMPAAEGTYLFHLVAPEQPGRRAARRAGRGPGRHPAAGRRRQGRRVPGRRAGPRRLPGEHPAGAGAANRQAAAGQQPGVPARLADDRGPAVRPRRRSPRSARRSTLGTGLIGDHRAGPAAGGRRLAARRGAALRLPGRGRRHRDGDRPADRGAWRRWTSTPRRCSGPVPAAPPTRTRSCRC